MCILYMVYGPCMAWAWETMCYVCVWSGKGWKCGSGLGLGMCVRVAYVACVIVVIYCILCGYYCGCGICASLNASQRSETESRERACELINSLLLVIGRLRQRPVREGGRGRGGRPVGWGCGSRIMCRSHLFRN